MNPHPLFSQIHSSFKANHKQQPKRHRVENRKVAEKPKQIGKGKGHHGRGSHHGPCWLPRASRGGHCPGGALLALKRRVLPSVLSRGLLVLGYLLWAFWACFLPL